MRKYLSIIRLTTQDVLAYPTQVYYWLCLSSIELFVMIYLWLNIYQDYQQISGFTLPMLITYYMLVMIIARLHNDAAFWLSELVKQGTLSAFLLRPINFLTFLIVDLISRKIISLLISVPFFIIIFSLVKNYFIYPENSITFILFILSLILSILIFFVLGSLIGLISFWTLEIGSLFYFYFTLLEFLGGRFLPLTFFPNWVATILNILPFGYLFHFPVTVYLGQLSTAKTINKLIIGTGWLIALFFTYQIIWNKGLKRYSSFGG